LSAQLNHNAKEKKLEELNSDLNNINISNNNVDEVTQVFKDKSKLIFDLIFDDPQELIKRIDQVNFEFYSWMYDEDDNYFYKQQTLEDGIRQARIILKSATEKLNLSKFKAENTNDAVENINQNNLQSPTKTDEIFIVHGHDNALKNEVALFLERLKLKPIILHEQLDRGQTIFQKFNSNSNVGFAIVLYTPCDVGRPLKLNEQGEQYIERNRARQNVIFEHGFFAAKLGLENVVALKKGDVEIPNDLSGVIYKEYDEGGLWKYQIARELQASNYEIDYNLIR